MAYVFSEIVEGLAQGVETGLFQAARQETHLPLPGGLTAHEGIVARCGQWQSRHFLSATYVKQAEPILLFHSSVADLEWSLRRGIIVAEVSSCLESIWPSEGRVLGSLQILETLAGVEAVLSPFAIPPDISQSEVSDLIWVVGNEFLAALNRNPALVYRLEPRRFEELVAELLDREGYSVELTPASRDGGLDIRASKRSILGSELLVVECKRFSAQNKVGIEIVQRLHGVARSLGASRGLVATTSFFTTPAVDFAERLEHQLALLDYYNLLRLVKRHGSA